MTKTKGQLHITWDVTYWEYLCRRIGSNSGAAPLLSNIKQHIFMGKDKMDVKLLSKKIELLEMRVKELEDMNIKLLINRVQAVEDDQYMLKDVFTASETCRFLDISQSQLYKLTSKLKIPHYKPRGKMVYFEKQELLKWIKKNHYKELRDDESKEKGTSPAT